MYKMKIAAYTKTAILLCLAVCATLFTGCSDDDDQTAALAEGQGEVTFKFTRNKVFTISKLEEMERLKVTLEKDGKRIDLTTVDLNGNEDELTSEAIALDEGTYKVVKYVAYNNKGTQVQEAYVDEENLITVKHDEMATFSFPIYIRFVYINNQLRNMLFGVCEEALGADSTQWPKTWRIENEDLLTWENLEFEVDDYGNVSHLISIIFNGKAFPGMKKLPATVSNFPTLENIQIQDIPEFEELPDNLDKSSLYSILMKNTGFKEFPKNFEKMKNLHTLTIINSRLTELPARLAELPQIRDVEISGNEIAEFPAVVAEKWQGVVSLRMNRTKLTTLPANIFSMKKVSSFDFCENPNLTSVPEVRGEGVAMGGLYLNDCGLTAIPKIAQQRLRTLSLMNNKITSVSSTELDALSKSLLVLKLDGNRLSSFPAMNAANLTELSLANCGLTAVPDLTNLPNLRSLSLANNNISTVGDGVFTDNEFLSILNLSDNANLTAFSNNAGIYLRPQTVNGQSAECPYYLHCVNVDNCPQLTWEIPGTWCHIENFEIYNKEDLKLAPRNVVVYYRNSPKVTRAKCWYDGCDETYKLPMSFDELMESLKK